ncbi:uncharacterized protein [Coffea arabica]|uniref:RRM domain-containing protein n=1 Tax=Coffea arabica TaxID=13443 RepID=A0ABM4U9A4_COFAR
MAFFNKARGILQHAVRKHINHEISASRPSIFEAIRCMSSKLFVGGLSYQTDQASLEDAFQKYGEVIEARIITDHQTGNSRGFGFVTFQSAEAASSAIMALDGKEFQGRVIKVNHAHDRAPRGGGGYRNYGGGYGGGGCGAGTGAGYGGSGGYGGGNYGGGNYGGGNYEGGNYGGGGNYDNNFGANQSGGSSGGGYGATAGDSYASGGAVGSYASTEGSYGGSSTYASGGGNYGGNNFESTNVGFDGGNNQNFGVASGGGASDNYFAGNDNAGGGFSDTGFNSNSGLSYGAGNQYGNNENNNVANADGSYDQNDGGGSFQDDDESHDVLDRRAP